MNDQPEHMTPWEQKEADEARAAAARRQAAVDAIAEKLKRQKRFQTKVLIRCGFTLDELVAIVDPEAGTLCVMPLKALT